MTGSAPGRPEENKGRTVITMNCDNSNTKTEMGGWRITGQNSRISKPILLLSTIIEEEPAAGGRQAKKRKRVQKSKVRNSISMGIQAARYPWHQTSSTILELSVFVSDAR